MLISQMGETLSAITCACGLHVCVSRQMVHARMWLCVCMWMHCVHIVWGCMSLCSRCMCVGVIESVIAPTMLAILNGITPMILLSNARRVHIYTRLRSRTLYPPLYGECVITR